jgi:NTE family protein
MKIKLTFLISLAILLVSANSAQCQTVNLNPPNTVNTIEVTSPNAVGNSSTVIKPPKVAIVLGGGGCKALAQIGVLEVFAKNNIPVNYIVGTSAGAIIGSLYAAGVPLNDIQEMFLDGSLQHALFPHMTPRLIGILLRKMVHLQGKHSYAGLTSGKKLEKFLNKKLPSDFSGLKIPFAAIATDLESGNTCMITSGDLCKSVVASSAIPPLVRPVTIGNTIFVDGGLKANLPTNCAQLTGAGIIVAIPADAPILPIEKSKFRSTRALVLRITDIMEGEIDRHRWKEADLVIYPEVGDIPGMTTDPEVIKRAIEKGRTAATAALPKLKQLLNGTRSHLATP